MTISPPDPSPQLCARAAGAIYLVVILFGMFSEGVVMGSVVVAGDPTRTLHNIAAQPLLWSLSTAGNLIVPLIAIVQLGLEYLLWRPVDRRLAQLFVLFNLVSLAVETVSKLFQLMAAPIVAGHGFAHGLDEGQRAVALGAALSAHDIGFNIALIFFGPACMLSGILIYRSGYVPRLIGVLMGVAGLCYLVACFAQLFAPAVADLISPAILLPPLVGESSLCLWLLIKGVNLDGWRRRVAGGPG